MTPLIWVLTRFHLVQTANICSCHEVASSGLNMQDLGGIFSAPAQVAAVCMMLIVWAGFGAVNGAICRSIKLSHQLHPPKLDFANIEF